MAETQVCALDGCEETFTPSRKNNVYHRPSCAQKASNDRRKDGAPRVTLSAPEDEEARAERRAEMKELRTLRTASVAREQYTATIAEHLGSYTPTVYDPPEGLRDDHADHLWVLHLSDWHIGQQIEGSRTGGLYYHDLAVAQEQVAKLRQVLWEIMRDGGRKVRKLLVIVNGDIVEGDDMRPSQHREIEMLVTEQTMEGFDLLRALLDSLRPMIEEEIVVSNVGGNHDRASRRPGNAGLAELGYVDSYAWLIGAMLQRWYANDPTITVHNWETFFGRLVFGGHKLVHSHGSDVNWSTGGYAGVPWNAISMAGKKYASMLGEFDGLFFGHGHIPAWLPVDPASHIFMNGSLPTSTGYVQSKFKAVRRPVQQLIMYNRHGAVANYPLYLDVGQAASADEIWIDDVPTIE